jgi:hypothetical protein
MTRGVFPLKLLELVNQLYVQKCKDLCGRTHLKCESTWCRTVVEVKGK